MTTAACLPIAADRAGACVRTIFFEGLDLTGVALALEARLNPETPGPANISLAMTTVANAEGIRFIGVTVNDGVPTSEITLRINETTMEDASKFPYSGELGSSSTLYYDLIGIFGQDKRRLVYGTLTALPTVYGMDGAPANRPEGGSARGDGSATWSSATLTYGDDKTVVRIDGADLMGAAVARATAAAERAEMIAEAVSIEPARGGWQDVVIDADSRVLSGYHPVLGQFRADIGALVAVIDQLDGRLEVVEQLTGGGGGAGEAIPRVGGWISATVDADGRVVTGVHLLLGNYPATAADEAVTAAVKVATLRALRLGDAQTLHPSPPKVSRRTLSKPLVADPDIVGRFDRRLTAPIPLVQTGSAYPLTELAHAAWITAADGSRYAPFYSIRFITDAPRLDIRYGYPGQLRVLVDGMPVSVARTLDLADGEDDWPLICIDFGADTRTIRPAYAVSAAGAGYAEGDVLTVAGAAGDPLRLTVTSVNADGSIRASGLRVQSWGTLTALQSGAVAATGGSGSGATITLSNNGGLSGHTTRRMRRIEIVLSDLTQFADLRVPKSSAVRPWPVAGPRLMVMQDSYGQVFPDYPQGVWAHRMAARLGIEDVWLNTMGGTGFTAGSLRYAQRLPDIVSNVPSPRQPLIFLTQGSINDVNASTSDLRTAVEAYWRAAFAALPTDAIMIQTGILRAPGNNPADTLSAAVRDGFAAACSAFDPEGKRSGFIETRAPLAMMTVPDATAEWISGDQAHPTQSGHDFIGDAFAPELLRILQNLAI